MTTRKLPPTVSRSTTTEQRPPFVPRRYPRVVIELPAQYALGDGEWHASMIDDLGGGGVRLLTAEDLAAGTQIALRFIVDGTPIVTSARVAMSLHDARRDRYVHGVAFTAIDPGAQQRIVDRVLALQQHQTA
jgi:c-di-GMP-binding flagellar brake protein YcgR